MKTLLAILTALAVTIPCHACGIVGASFGYGFGGYGYSLAVPFIPQVSYAVPYGYAAPAPCLSYSAPQVSYAAPAPQIQAEAPAPGYAAPAPVQAFAPAPVYGGGFAVAAPFYSSYGYGVRSRAFFGVGYGNGGFATTLPAHAAFRGGNFRAVAVAPVAPRRVVTRTRTVTRIR